MFNSKLFSNANFNGIKISEFSAYDHHFSDSILISKGKKNRYFKVTKALKLVKKITAVP
jgi:hypothetical protein